MNDLISRQAAIEVIDAVFPVDPMKSEYAQGIACGAALAKTYVDQLPYVQPEQWIPCSERLPSKADHIDNMVLVCYGNGSVRFNTYMNGWVQGNPVAWMPLPEPYKEEQE